MQRPDLRPKRAGASWFSSLPCFGGESQSACLLLLVSASLLLNLAVCGMLLTGSFASSPSGLVATPAQQQSQQQLLSVAGDAPETIQLRADLVSWKGSHRAVTEQFELLKQRYTDLADTHKETRKALVSAQEAAATAAAAAAAAAAAGGAADPADAQKLKDLTAQVSTLQSELRSRQSALDAALTKLAAAPAAGSADGACTPCASGALDHSRLLASDLTLSKFDFASHELTWQCDSAVLEGDKNTSLVFCPESSTNEQYFQLQFFDRPGAGSRAAIRKPKPQAPGCVQLPPRDFKFPAKVQSMPLALGEAAVHWPNLRVQKLEDLLVFNMGTPKNLYHFNASFYDYEQEHILDASAKFIPWGHKVRLMLDVGSGGASLGMLAKRRYDVQVVSTVFADWPYCEYITDRGQVCMYIDAMEAMPFAKFSYDVVHSSWVFHALFNDQLRTAFLEQNRVLRPGGYMWIYGGWSFAQVATIKHLLVDQLGYGVLQEVRNIVDTTKVKHSFDSIPFELEWTAILVKPIRVDENKCNRVAADK